MLRIEKYIEEVFMTAIHKLYPDKELKPIEISIATNEKFGDFQTNFAMMNSKIIGGNPRKIAEEIVNEIGTCNHLIEKLEIAGPGFINIFLKDEYLGEYVSKMTTEKFEYTELNTKGDVIIDYSSPNIAKRMHIGHLRSTIIGDAVKRLYNFLGYHTVADNHIGDWGTQFGKLIIGYRKWLDKEAYEKNPIEELERVYVEFSKESENDPSLDDLAREELKKLQDGDKENYALWQEFIKVSLDEYNKLYNRMGITFDTYYGESFYHNMMPAVLDELVEKGLAVEDQGAKVVFFDEKDNLHPCIVQKKDGAFLYSTSDIATVKFRKENYDINRLIYLTDERQQDHFKQFFKITEMLGWDIEKIHIWFGIMRFADGVFSTRKGNVIRLEQLLDEGKKRALEVIEEKNPSLSDEEKNNIAEVVGVGAIKYADLSQNRQSPIIFEWDKVLSFEGNTAPYLQYSYARIQSIKKKAEEMGKVITSDTKIVIKDKIERNLVTFLTLFPTMVLKAGETYKPNLLTDYLFDLAKKFNTFYNACPILNQEDEVLLSRLLIADRTAEILRQGLDLLGIKTVDRM
ncbi:MAG: arginine--tRNA ligase [Fusobacterium sp.]